MSAATSAYAIFVRANGLIAVRGYLGEHGLVMLRTNAKLFVSLEEVDAEIARRGWIKQNDPILGKTTVSVRSLADHDPDHVLPKRQVTASGSEFWTLHTVGGVAIGWDGRPWEPGKTNARFWAEIDCWDFAEAHGLTVAECGCNAGLLFGHPGPCP